MNLLQMSLAGAIMILAIIGIRGLMLHKLPKVTFMILWGIVLLRLLVPIEIPSVFSVYSLMERFMESREEIPGRAMFMDWVVNGGGTDYAMQAGKKESVGTSLSEEKIKTSFNEKAVATSGNEKVFNMAETLDTIGETAWSVAFAIWITGVMLCVGYFMTIYFKCRREFQMSLPVENEIIKEWQEVHARRHILIRQSIRIRQSDCVLTPLSYGIVHPVILLPKTTDWRDGEAMQYILEHELVHIQRQDMFWKLVMTVAVCIHWFNPLVWMMYFLFNRDMELACDEAVIRHFGEHGKSFYARMLICMEEKRSGLTPFYAGFSKNAIEERIKAIMKMKKNSIFMWIGAVIIITIVIAALGTSSGESNLQEMDLIAENSAESTENPEFSENLEPTGTTEPEYLEEYEKYGVSYKNQHLYYNGERIRYFLDGYDVDGNIFGRYLSWDAKGTVDVHTVRNDIQKEDGSVELFGDIIDIVASSQEEFDARDVSYGRNSDMAVSEVFQETANVNGNTVTLSVLTEEMGKDAEHVEIIRAEPVSEAQGNSNNEGGRTFEEIFKTYEKLGITYEETIAGLGNLYWNEITVSRLTDNWSESSFSFESTDGGDISVIIVHDVNGNPSGLVTVTEKKE